MAMIREAPEHYTSLTVWVRGEEGGEGGEEERCRDGVGGGCQTVPTGALKESPKTGAQIYCHFCFGLMTLMFLAAAIIVKDSQSRGIRGKGCLILLIISLKHNSTGSAGRWSKNMFVSVCL